MTTVLSKLARALTGARDVVRSLRDADAELRQAHAAAQQERSDLINLKPPKQDLVCEVARQVDAIATKWSADHGDAIVAAAGGALNVLPSGEVRGVQRGDMLSAFPGQLTIADLIAICPELVKARLVAAVESTTYEAGPPLDARPPLIEKADERLADLERQHAALVDEASAAGIALEHLPGERVRRFQAAARAEVARLHNETNAAAIRRGAVEPR